MAATVGALDLATCFGTAPLRTPSGNSEPVSNLLKCDVVAVYFSAHWCPPCRMFTPQLAEAYRHLKSLGKAFEVVYVSSDNALDKFEEYHSSMPWLAVPFEDQDTKQGLFEHFKVSGIPMLVLMNAKGEIITTKGKELVHQSGWQGIPFPEPEPVVHDVSEVAKDDSAMGLFSYYISNGSLVDNKSKTIPASNLTAMTATAFYFPSGEEEKDAEVESLLKTSYKELNVQGKVFEVVFVSKDETTDLEPAMASMPWLAIPADDETSKERLWATFNLQTFPAIVFCDSQGIVQSTQGVKLLKMAGSAGFPFTEEHFRNHHQAQMAIKLEQKKKAKEEAKAKTIAKGQVYTGSLKGTRAVRLDYIVASQTWKRTEISVAVEEKSFAKGAMRAAFRMRVLADENGYEDRTVYVAKRYFDQKTGKYDQGITKNDYFSDVMVQCWAQQFARMYNRMDPPKEVYFIPTYLIKLMDEPGQPIYLCEPMLRGQYTKHNGNTGWVDDKMDRSTPQAFTHYTYEASAGQYMVCDIQGVAYNISALGLSDESTPDDKSSLYFWTDPQLHSHDRSQFGKGNLGTAGMHAFFSTHQCNSMCQYLGLPMRSGYFRAPSGEATVANPVGVSQNERVAGASTLPAGWQKLVTPDGTPYYVDPSGRPTWSPPLAEAPKDSKVSKPPGDHKTKKVIPQVLRWLGESSESDGEDDLDLTFDRSLFELPLADDTSEGHGDEDGAQYAHGHYDYAQQHAAYMQYEANMRYWMQQNQGGGVYA